MFDDLLVVLFPSRRNPFEHFFKAGLTISIFGWKIGSANERFQVRGQPDAHWPAATAGGRLDESHINTINIGTFFPIDFDIHKFAIHDPGHVFAFERFVSHDMTPVASRVTNRQEDWFAFTTRFSKRYFTPRIPIDRIMRVLQTVWRFFMRQ